MTCTYMFCNSFVNALRCLPIGQNYDYISDKARFNQEAEDKQDWNCYTKRCIVIKENRFRYVFNNDQSVGTDKSRSCKEIRH